MAFPTLNRRFVLCTKIFINPCWFSLTNSTSTCIWFGLQVLLVAFMLTLVLDFGCVFSFFTFDIWFVRIKVSLKATPISKMKMMVTYSCFFWVPALSFSGFSGSQAILYWSELGSMFFRRHIPHIIQSTSFLYPTVNRLGNIWNDCDTPSNIPDKWTTKQSFDIIGSRAYTNFKWKDHSCEPRWLPQSRVRIQWCRSQRKREYLKGSVEYSLVHQELEKESRYSWSFLRWGKEKCAFDSTKGLTKRQRS